MRPTALQRTWWYSPLQLAWRLSVMFTIIFALGWFAYQGLAETYEFRWEKAWKFIGRYHSGLLMTLQVSLVAAVGATVLGLLIALSRLSPWVVVRDLAGLYVHTIRNLPFIVVMLIFFFGLRKGVDLNSITMFGYTFEAPFVWGAIALTLYEASYMAEVIRAGIESVRSTQMEAARSMGMSYPQAMRYVVLPQAVSVILPPSTSIFIGLVKESALLSIIGLPELTRTAVDLFAPVRRPYTFEFYVFLAGYYLSIVVPLSLLSQWLETHLRIDRKIGVEDKKIVEEAARGI